LRHKKRHPGRGAACRPNLLEKKGATMSAWFDRLRFLWEEEIAPPEEVPRVDREEPAGVPRPLRRAARFALIGVVATSLMAQIIGVRLVAPVDAAPVHPSQCLAQCRAAYTSCVAGCPKGAAGGACRASCSRTLATCSRNCGQP
jgi:hypothetical protein